MSHINRKYIDSHWFIFIIKGLLGVIFGWIALFSSNRTFESMVTVVGIFLLSLSVVEFINALYRAQKKTGWAVSLALAIIDATVALALLFTLKQDTTWHLILIAVYTILRGLCEIISGFRTTIDPTDRFTWVFGGMCGCIMGLVILNSGEYFIRFFGAYLFAFGICSLLYGVHNRAQKTEDLVARREAARLAANSRKKNTRKNRLSKKSK
ncbi:DUF308 domain-containing protein [Candidatus Saccharibacteria bacterium]|nr:DUF308 domain-containing protein [Candidatus Saccharibacteria bacterium]